MRVKTTYEIIVRAWLKPERVKRIPIVRGWGLAIGTLWSETGVVTNLGNRADAGRGSENRVGGCDRLQRFLSPHQATRAPLQTQRLEITIEGTRSEAKNQEPRHVMFQWSAFVEHGTLEVWMYYEPV
jgi:hypothetical protein